MGDRSSSPEEPQARAVAQRLGQCLDRASGAESRRGRGGAWYKGP
jgi:hypothetical protein